MFFNKKNKEENTSNLVKIAALLIHTAKIDQNYSIEEEEIIKKTLVSLGAEQSDLDNLITKASKSEENANQILEFNRENKKIEEMDKIKIVKSLWKIIYSNKDADIYETNLITVYSINTIDISININNYENNNNNINNCIKKNNKKINPMMNIINQLKSNLSQSLSNIRSTNEITYNNLLSENARISSQLYSAPEKQREFRDIKRQQDIKESLYLYLLEKREESAINHGVSSPNAKIVDKAYASNKPISPKKTVIVLAALILGFCVPIGLIYLRNLLDTKVHSIKDVKKVVDIPFIGDIPKSNKRKQLINKVDYSPKAEAFRMVRTNIDFMLKGIENRAKTIFVTSTTSKEGKSHTSINLALSLSFSEKKILLVETDIRVPKATNYLNVKNEVGLTNYISDPHLKLKDVIVKLEDNNFLDVIPSGVIPPNPAELLMSDRMQELFDKVSNDYDYIIVDTAAVGLVTDTMLIGHHADLFIYVVRANYLDKRQLHLAETIHNEKRLPNMTILLNGVNHKKGNGYGYGYGKNPNKKKWWKFS